MMENMRMVLDTPSSQVLDYDVLLAVMSQCDKSSVASLMRTCSTMYHAGAKHVLDGNVLLWNPGLIDSFCHFMLAEDGTRFRLLRELTLATGSVPKKAIPMLLKVILKMDHLESLKMMDSENLLASHLKLSKHIVRLPGLRHLTLHNACARSTQMVRRIRSKLITFHIDYGAVDDGTFLESLDDVERLRHHPAFLCQAFRSTLEEMVTAYDDPHEEQPHSDALVYPKLWKLRVYEELPWAHPYVCTFPNVTHLSIRSLYDTEPFSDDLMVEYMQHRQVSMQKQMDRGTWLKLREYDGGQLGLFLIGLTCRIPRVSLHPIRRDNLQLLESILDSAKPEVLQLSVVHADIFGPSDKELPAILRLPCCATLKKVQITVDIGLEARNVNISNSMDNLRESLITLSIESLEVKLVAMSDLARTRRTYDVRVDPDAPDGVVVIPSTGPPAPLLPVERSLARFDPSGYTQRLSDAIATLKEVSIDVNGPRDRRSTARWTRSEDVEMRSA